MTRKLIHENARVVIDPQPPMHFARHYSAEEVANHLMTEARRLEAEVRRHVHGFQQVRVKTDLVTACGYRAWTHDDTGNALGRWPECCEQDQVDFFMEHSEESDEWFAERGMDNAEHFRHVIDIAEEQTGKAWR